MFLLEIETSAFYAFLKMRQKITPRKHLAHQSPLVPPALLVFAKYRNVLMLQINLMVVLTDHVLLAAACSAAKSSPVCNYLVELLDDSLVVVITSEEDVPERVNTAMSNTEEDVGHAEFRAVNFLDDSEGERRGCFTEN